MPRANSFLMRFACLLAVFALLMAEATADPVEVPQEAAELPPSVQQQSVQEAEGQIPLELRDHVSHTYRSATVRQEIAAAFQRIEEGPGDRASEGIRLLVDLHDMGIVTWLMTHIGRCNGVFEEVSARDDVRQFLPAMISGMRVLAPVDMNYPRDDDTDPATLIFPTASLVSQALGIPHTQPESMTRGIVEEWLRERFRIALQRAPDEEARTWLRYCLARWTPSDS